MTSIAVNEIVLIAFLYSAMCLFLITPIAFGLSYFVALTARPSERAAWTSGVAFVIVTSIFLFGGVSFLAITAPLAALPGGMIAYWFCRRKFQKAWQEDSDVAKEGQIPLDLLGRPDLSYYKHDAVWYATIHANSLLDDGNFSDRVHASWGLIANGATSIPYALSMLESASPDARADGAGILSAIGKPDSIVNFLIRALAKETETEARDSLIQALGVLGNQAAISALATFIESEATDGDTQWTAIESLGRIVQRSFVDETDPIASARAWLESSSSGDTSSGRALGTEEF